jgi:hypothetical protein
MTINIKNSKADRLVQELGELTGEIVLPMPYLKLLESHFYLKEMIFLRLILWQ